MTNGNIKKYWEDDERKEKNRENIGNGKHKIGDKFRMIMEVSSEVYITREETIEKAIEAFSNTLCYMVEEEIGFLWDDAFKEEGESK